MRKGADGAVWEAGAFGAGVFVGGVSALYSTLQPEKRRQDFEGGDKRLQDALWAAHESVSRFYLVDQYGGRGDAGQGGH